MPFTVGAKTYVYAGGGPQFNFVEQKFEQGEAVNFSDFHYSTALNILLGIQHRGEMFAELKTSIYASPAPVLRLIVGLFVLIADWFCGLISRPSPADQLGQRRAASYFANSGRLL